MHDVATAKKKKRVAEPEEIPHPFVKYPGGKRRLLPELCKRLPERIDNYREPFAGGAALFWHLKREGLIRGTATLCDVNERLVRGYRGIRDDVEQVIAKLRDHSNRHALEGRAYYAEMTSFDARSYTADALVAAWLVYVNRAGYNGLFRTNKTGKFNVPFGDGSPLNVNEENLRACSRALDDVDVCLCDFADLRGCVGDFHYFDAPYAPRSATANFTSYGPGKFTTGDQRRLAEHAATLKRSGARVMLTNADVPLIHELYPEPFWKVERVKVRGDSLNSDANGRGKLPELIIT